LEIEEVWIAKKMAMLTDEERTAAIDRGKLYERFS
jgi:hypothetical protein